MTRELILSLADYQLLRKILKVDPDFNPQVSAQIRLKAIALGMLKEQSDDT